MVDDGGDKTFEYRVLELRRNETAQRGEAIKQSCCLIGEEIIYVES
jgi:hypothetical protein